jgi:hypothetical protein
MSLRGCFAILALVVGGACIESQEDPSHPPPILPTTPKQFAPSQASVEGGAVVLGSNLADVSVCATCHDDVAAQWRTSAHAFASFNNPIYRASVDRFRSQVGQKPSRFCGGCHDVSLLVDGAMDADIAPNDARASAGVSCHVCHGAVQTRPDGNGSYVLAATPIPIPDMNDPASIALHKQRAAPAPLRTPELCGSCHRAFLDETTGNRAFLAGMDEYGPWSRSGYAGSKLARIDDPPAQAACKDCHMPREDARLGDVSAKGGKIASHRFVGGHTWLAAMRGDRDALQRVQHNLDGAASIDVAAVASSAGTTMPADGAPVAAGDRLLVDVVVRNLRVGHRFPGGTLDAADTWIELRVEDSKGRTLAEAGTQEEASGEDPTAHVLRALVAGDDGAPLLTRETHRFRAVVANHSLAPRDAEVVEYAFDVPASLGRAPQPLRVEARLRHRSHDLALQRTVCDAARERGGSTLDPCAPQPVTEIARAQAWIGQGASEKPSRSARPAWRRLFDLGLAEQHNVQERLEEGRPSLEQAWTLVERDGTETERAMVLGALAWLPAHEGRTSDALEQIDRAARFAPGHPALASLRGAALEQVWRWSEAIAPLRDAVRSAPRDDLAAARLAVALGSAGEEPEAFEEARLGLRLAPRDPDLLRVQALAVRALGLTASIDAAEEAYLACRPADDAPDIRAACAANVPGCALERIGVHMHLMRSR